MKTPKTIMRVITSIMLCPCAGNYDREVGNRVKRERCYQNEIRLGSEISLRYEREKCGGDGGSIDGDTDRCGLARARNSRITQCSRCFSVLQGQGQLVEVTSMKLPFSTKNQSFFPYPYHIEMEQASHQSGSKR